MTKDRLDNSRLAKNRCNEDGLMPDRMMMDRQSRRSQKGYQLILTYARSMRSPRRLEHNTNVNYCSDDFYEFS